MALPSWIARHEPACASVDIVMMRILSLNAGFPRTFAHDGREVATGIFKEPVSGPRMLRLLNLDGDGQADLQNHGGRDKAVYAYPSEHYPVWRRELPGMELPWAIFGENLTTEGLREEDACIGDEYRAGGAMLRVRQPRIPCYKLGIRFGRADIVKKFLASGRSGIYFSVVGEGMVSSGDPIERIHRDAHGISVADAQRAYLAGPSELPLLRRVVRAEILPTGLQQDLLRRLATLEK